MKFHMNVLLITFIFCCCLAGSYAEGADKLKFQSEPLQRLDVRYRLFRTDNMWSYLLLDTSDGRLWHVTFTTEDKGARLKLPVNEKPLVAKNSSKKGKFALYPTDNMWNFILLDQDDGRVWQCQFTMEGNNFCLPIQDARNLLQQDSGLKSDQSCEDECRALNRTGQLKEGVTLQDCISSLCK